MQEKNIHIVFALATALFGILLAYYFYDLRKDAVSIFSTVSGFFTLYGVLFTVIEIIRVKSVAQQSTRAAQQAAEAVRKLYGVQNIADCHASIEMALANIDNDGIVQSSSLNRIIKLYAAEFHQQYNSGNFDHLDNVAMLQSYVFARSPGKKPANARLKKALLGMTAQLSVAAGTRTSGEVAQ